MAVGTGWHKADCRQKRCFCGSFLAREATRDHPEEVEKIGIVGQCAVVGLSSVKRFAVALLSPEGVAEHQSPARVGILPLQLSPSASDGLSRGQLTAEQGCEIRGGKRGGRQWWWQALIADPRLRC